MGLLGRLRSAGREWIARPAATVAEILPPVAVGRMPLFHPDVPVILLWSEGAGRARATAWFMAQLGPGATGSPAEAAAALAARDGYRRDLARALRTRSHRVVKVVRDPPDRAAAGFLALVAAGGRPGRHAWAQEHWREAERWLTARGLDPAQGLSFVDHLALLAEGRPRPGALAPQHVRGEDELVDEVVPVERFARWAEEAGPRLGLRPPAPWADGPEVLPQAAPAGRARGLDPRPETVPLRRGGWGGGAVPGPAALVNDRSMPAIRAAYAPDFAAYGVLYGL